MVRKLSRFFVAAMILLFVGAGFAFSAPQDAAFTTSNEGAAAPAPTADPLPAKSARNNEMGDVGVGVRLSLLGAGAEAAVSLGHHLNVRGGFNLFSYSRNFSHDGVSYKGQLNLRSGEAHLDFFPFGNGFHLSPGLLLYNGNGATANVTVPGGSTFTLGGNSYMSDPTNPIGGTGKLDFRKVSPSAMIGFGNLVPRHGHFSLNLEAGVVFQGAARTKLGLTGNACLPDGSNCVDAATDPNVQASVQAEQVKLNNKLSPFQYYPVLAFGFGYRF